MDSLKFEKNCALGQAGMNKKLDIFHLNNSSLPPNQSKVMTSFKQVATFRNSTRKEVLCSDMKSTEHVANEGQEEELQINQFYKIRKGSSIPFSNSAAEEKENLRTEAAGRSKANFPGHVKDKVLTFEKKLQFRKDHVNDSNVNELEVKAPRLHTSEEVPIAFEKYDMVTDVETYTISSSLSDPPAPATVAPAHEQRKVSSYRERPWKPLNPQSILQYCSQPQKRESSALSSNREQCAAAPSQHICKPSDKLSSNNISKERMIGKKDNFDHLHVSLIPEANSRNSSCDPANYYSPRPFRRPYPISSFQPVSFRSDTSQLNPPLQKLPSGLLPESQKSVEESNSPPVNSPKPKVFQVSTPLNKIQIPNIPSSPQQLVGLSQVISNNIHKDPQQAAFRYGQQLVFHGRTLSRNSAYKQNHPHPVLTSPYSPAINALSPIPSTGRDSSSDNENPSQSIRLNPFSVKSTDVHFDKAGENLQNQPIAEEPKGETVLIAEALKKSHSSSAKGSMVHWAEIGSPKDEKSCKLKKTWEIQSDPPSDGDFKSVPSHRFKSVEGFSRKVCETHIEPCETDIIPSTSGGKVKCETDIIPSTWDGKVKCETDIIPSTWDGKVKYETDIIPSTSDEKVKCETDIIPSTWNGKVKCETDTIPSTSDGKVRYEAEDSVEEDDLEKVLNNFVEKRVHNAPVDIKANLKLFLLKEMQQNLNGEEYNEENQPYQDRKMEISLQPSKTKPIEEVKSPTLESIRNFKNEWMQVIRSYLPSTERLKERILEIASDIAQSIADEIFIPVPQNSRSKKEKDDQPPPLPSFSFLASERGASHANRNKEDSPISNNVRPSVCDNKADHSEITSGPSLVTEYQSVISFSRQAEKKVSSLETGKAHFENRLALCSTIPTRLSPQTKKKSKSYSYRETEDGTLNVSSLDTVNDDWSQRLKEQAKFSKVPSSDHSKLLQSKSKQKPAPVFQAKKDSSNMSKDDKLRSASKEGRYCIRSHQIPTHLNPSLESKEQPQRQSQPEVSKKGSENTVTSGKFSSYLDRDRENVSDQCCSEPEHSSKERNSVQPGVVVKSPKCQKTSSFQYNVPEMVKKTHPAGSQNSSLAGLESFPPDSDDSVDLSDESTCGSSAQGASSLSHSSKVVTHPASVGLDDYQRSTVQKTSTSSRPQQGDMSDSLSLDIVPKRKAPLLPEEVRKQQIELLKMQDHSFGASPSDVAEPRRSHSQCVPGRSFKHLHPEHLSESLSRLNTLVQGAAASKSMNTAAAVHQDNDIHNAPAYAQQLSFFASHENVWKLDLLPGNVTIFTPSAHKENEIATQLHENTDQLPRFSKQVSDFPGPKKKKKRSQKTGSKSPPKRSNESCPKAKTSNQSLTKTKTSSQSLAKAKTSNQSLKAKTNFQSLPKTKTSNQSLPKAKTSNQTLPKAKTSNQSLPETKTSKQCLPSVPPSSPKKRNYFKIFDKLRKPKSSKIMKAASLPPTPEVPTTSYFQSTSTLSPKAKTKVKKKPKKSSKPVLKGEA